MDLALPPRFQHPHQDLWDYISPLVERYDAVVLSLPKYAQTWSPQRFILPAINPFSTTNKELSDGEIKDRFEHHKIPTDLPLVVQVSRFDKWKDPQGVIDAFRHRAQAGGLHAGAGRQCGDRRPGRPGCVLLAVQQAEEHIRILSVQDTALVNALQRRAAVVLQKSIREGFGLTVTEAMWKGAP